MSIQNRLSPSQLKLAPLFCLVFLPHFFSFESEASNYRFRARESYEYYDAEFRGQELDYKGLSNTINFWYEKPFDISYGLAGGALFSSAKTSQTSTNGLSQKINFYFLGLETKYFFTQAIKGLFSRIGLYWNTIDTNSNLGKLNGWHYYASLGWEFHIFDKVTLAPEIGIKQGDTQGIFFTNYSFAIGVHFY